MAVERFVVVGKERTRIRVLEDGTGEPVLLIHGIGGWAETWGTIPASLAAAGYRVYTCDLPGFGRSSPAPVGARYFQGDPPYYVRFVNDLLDALEVARAHLAGHSLGGIVTGMAAALSPQRVCSLSLLAPGGWRARMSLAFRLATLPLADALAARTPWPIARPMVRSVITDAFHRQARIPQSLFNEGERYAKGGATVEFARVMGQACTWSGPKDELLADWRKRAGTIAASTLVVWGREDGVLPMPTSAEIAQLLPRAHVRIVDDCGHLLTIERPAQVGPELLRFLAQVRCPSSAPPPHYSAWPHLPGEKEI